MSSYSGRYGALYDIIYRDKPYAREAAFVDALAREHAAFGGGECRLLDLACGTGRHLLEFEKLGYAVTGIDHSEALLSVARQNALQGGSRARFVQSDMRTFDLGTDRFDVATCLFDSIGYAVTNEGVAKALDRVAWHLADGALFFVEYWHAAAMLRAHEPCRVSRWPLPDGELIRTAETRLDVPRQTCDVAYTLFERGAEGAVLVHEETQTNRFFLVQEMGLLLANAGFEVLQSFAGYDRHAPLDTSAFHVLALARKARENE